MKKIIFLLILLLLIPACAKKRIQDPVQYVTKLADLPDCPRPDKLQLEKLDVAQHLGSTSNVNQLDEIILSLITYNNQLEATIDCYEKRKSVESQPKELTGASRTN